MSLIFKQLYNGESVKTNNGLVFKILTIGADDTSFTPTPSLVYTLSSDGTYYIVGTGFTDLATLETDTSGGTSGSGLDSTWSGGELYIPNTYNDKPVLAIASKAFQFKSNITKCYIQNGITHIGNYAFNMSYKYVGLESIELPKSLTYLGKSSFVYNQILTSIDLQQVTYIGAGALQNTYSLMTVIIRQENQVCTLTNTNTFYNSCHITGTINTKYNPYGAKDGYIYVPDSLVDSYKVATNWSKHADQIKPLSELPQEYKDLYNIA